DDGTLKAKEACGDRIEMNQVVVAGNPRILAAQIFGKLPEYPVFVSLGRLAFARTALALVLDAMEQGTIAFPDDAAGAAYLGQNVELQAFVGAALTGDRTFEIQYFFRKDRAVLGYFVTQMHEADQWQGEAGVGQ